MDVFYVISNYIIFYGAGLATLLALIIYVLKKNETSFLLAIIASILAFINQIRVGILADWQFENLIYTTFFGFITIICILGPLGLFIVKSYFSTKKITKKEVAVNSIIPFIIFCVEVFLLLQPELGNSLSTDVGFRCFK